MESTIWQQKWVVGNWKMNGQLHDNNALVHKLRSLPAAERVCIGISPPTVYLLQAHNAVQIVLDNKIHVCAQDVSRFADKGAYTGEVSAEMLKDVGVDIVLIGHSERSLYFNEKNDVQRQKIENVLRVGLIPLLCVGERLKTQNFAVAYEPVWAIGTGKVATKEQIADMHQFIYNEILSLCGNDANIRILYGGSVNDKNAADIFSVPHVDGALVGGASLKYESFTAIIHAAQEAQ